MVAASPDETITAVAATAIIAPTDTLGAQATGRTTDLRVGPFDPAIFDPLIFDAGSTIAAPQFIAIKG